MEKAFWQAIKESDHAVPVGHKPVDLVAELTRLLGSTDSELRDDLALEILANWIMRGLYTGEELRSLAAQLRVNLAHGIGEAGTDTVFLRAFSPLILRVILDYDAQNQALSAQELSHLLTAATSYLIQEQDQRGYVPGQGWAHACAHTADLLGALARHPGIGADGLHRILHAIGERLKAAPTEGYVAAEEARLASAVVEVLRRQELTPGELTGWIRQLITGTDWRACMRMGRPTTFFTFRTFLSDLLIQVTYRRLPPEVGSAVAAEIEGGLRTLTPWFFR